MEVDDWLDITKNRIFFEWDEDERQKALIGFLALLQEAKAQELLKELKEEKRTL